jgi:hypothetical protein
LEARLIDAANAPSEEAEEVVEVGEATPRH